MPVKQSGIDDYKQASNEIWGLFKRHIDVKDNDEWWLQFVRESDAIYDKWKEAEIEDYVKNYIITCQKEISRIGKKRMERKTD